MIDAQHTASVPHMAPGGSRPDGTRIAILYSRLSGYTAACLKTLKERHNVELMVVRRPPAQEAPFDAATFNWIDVLRDRNEFQPDELLDAVERFDPHAVFISGWLDRGYLHVARALKKRNVPVIAGSDTQWTGSLRQQVGRLIAPWYLHSAIDVLWVSGERQRQLARRLGFTGARCWSGSYACDWDRFAEVYRHGTERPKAFLYVGRYVDVKGLDVLVEAYRRYRARVAEPWPLLCAGAGDKKTLLDQQEGIVDQGFVQPEQLPERMGQAAAFVLPSRREPWGVVVQEAAAVGLPLICSDACGAAVHLLQDRYNGFLFTSGDAEHLAQCMMQMTEQPRETWEAMSRRSHLLSKQYTPERWADTFIEGIAAWRGSQG